MKKRLVIAMTGATGALYFERTLRAVLAAGHHADLVISKYGRLTLEEETTFAGFEGSVPDWIRAKYGDEVAAGSMETHSNQDQTSSIASGSSVRDGMIVVPCTMKTVAGIAHGYAQSLIERAADVMLKERKPLVLVPREAPYNLIHLENMASLTRAGAAIVPASPAFYQKPKTFEDLADFIAARALALVGLQTDLFPKWTGIERD